MSYSCRLYSRDRLCGISEAVMLILSRYAWLWGHDKFQIVVRGLVGAHL
jgi:hypothetical protein